MKGWAALGLVVIACGNAHPPEVGGLPAKAGGTGGAPGQRVAEARITPPEPSLSVEGALGIREFLATPQTDLPDRIRIRGFVVRGRSPDVDLADLPLMQDGWMHLGDVPPERPELILYRYYVFELVRWDPDPEGNAIRQFYYAAHAAADPPRGPSAPTYPDGSWSVHDLFLRTDLKSGQRVLVTATIVLVSYHCPPCPPRRHCSRCRPPTVTFEDDPAKPEGLISMGYQPGAFSPNAFGKRNVFEFEIDPGFPGALRFLSNEPPPESTL